MLLVLRLVSRWSWALRICVLMLRWRWWHRITMRNLRPWLLLRLALLRLLILLRLLTRLLWLLWWPLLWLWLLLLLLLLLGLLLGAPQSMTLQSDLGSTSGTSDKITVHVLVDRDVRRLWSNRKLTLERSTLRSLLCISARLGRLSPLGCFLSLQPFISKDYLNQHTWSGMIQTCW